MATVSVRIDKDLALQAEREARIQNRSNAKQIEYWAKIGKAISSKLSIEDVFAVSQGIIKQAQNVCYFSLKIINSRPVLSAIYL